MKLIEQELKWILVVAWVVYRVPTSSLDGKLDWLFNSPVVVEHQVGRHELADEDLVVVVFNLESESISIPSYGIECSYNMADVKVRAIHEDL